MLPSQITMNGRLLLLSRRPPPKNIPHRMKMPAATPRKPAKRHHQDVAVRDV